MKRDKSISNVARKFAIQVVHRLRDNGFVAYFAGGCVRDQLLSITPTDYDVATSALPGEVRHIFGPRRTLAIGESFGVIAVLGPKHVPPIEVATFRSDGNYSDGRHPDNVVYSTPDQDAARRDFTINGMFYDPIVDEVIDFVGGQADLQGRLIRAIGDPLERIAEDRLRMLRGVRFAASYGFEVEDKTFAAIRTQSAQIVSVSQERITNELERMLCRPNCVRAAELLQASGLLASTLPGLSDLALTNATKWERLLAILARYHKPPMELLLATILGTNGVDLGTAALHAECRRLKVSNQVRTACQWIAGHATYLAKASELPFSELQPLLINDHITSALTMLDAMHSVVPNATIVASVARCRALLGLTDEELNPAPLLRGHDLAALPIQPGPLYKRILEAIRRAQLDEVVLTKQQALATARQLVQAWSQTQEPDDTGQH